MPATLVGLLVSKTATGPVQPVLIRLHAPLAMQMFYAPMRWIMPSFPPIGDLLWHPVLIAAWVGLFITSLNLIPALQLDGGHILYAISRRWHRWITIGVPAVLLIAGLTLWVGWFIVGANFAGTGDATFLCAFGAGVAWVASDLWLGGAADARADSSAGPLRGCGIAGVSAVGDNIAIAI